MKVGIGQDSHRFLKEASPDAPCIIGGVVFPDVPGFEADSDGDVVLHSLCNAITSITHVPILGGIAQHLCRESGVTDSKEYLKRALETLDGSIAHIAFSLEGKRPKIEPKTQCIRRSVAELCSISEAMVGLTSTSGDMLTDFARGKGMQCLCILTLH